MAIHHKTHVEHFFTVIASFKLNLLLNSSLLIYKLFFSLTKTTGQSHLSAFSQFSVPFCAPFPLKAFWSAWFCMCTITSAASDCSACSLPGTPAQGVLAPRSMLCPSTAAVLFSTVSVSWYQPWFETLCGKLQNKQPKFSIKYHSE